MDIRHHTNEPLVRSLQNALALITRLGIVISDAYIMFLKRTVLMCVVYPGSVYGP